MRIAGHTVESLSGTRMGGCPSWYVKDADGKTVAGITIYYSSNSPGPFCANYFGRWWVTAHGPSYYKAMGELEGMVMASHEMSHRAEAIAKKAGHVKKWDGSASRKSEALSAARKVIREEAWAWVKQVLGVEA